MENVVIIDKPLGVTSYDVIRDLKKKYPGKKIGHAGTLDPLASGVLICLLDEANSKQSEFMDVDKDYEFDVLFGFKTDTYDILGFIQDYKEYEVEKLKEEVPLVLGKFVGHIEQKVPPFSAVKVKGKPLYRWYLDGKINQVEIPVKEIEIKSLEMVEARVLTNRELLEEVEGLLEKVTSGFRVKEVSKKWLEIVSNIPTDQKFLVAKLKANVSKGTYVRGIAESLGEALGVNACTITIRRTRVGDYVI